MGRIVSATYMSLDGDIQNMQDWHFDYFNHEAARAATAQMFTCDALVMGRETYDGFAQAWPAQKDESGQRMNNLEKYVVSSTMTNPGWNNTTVISGDVVGQLRALKERKSTILQYGYGPVTRLMLDHGLLDELRFWVHPVLSGKSKSSDLLYQDLAQQNRLTLNGVETHSSGIVILSYSPVSVQDGSGAEA